jgi:hypothetical protein
MVTQLGQQRPRMVMQPEQQQQQRPRMVMQLEQQQECPRMVMQLGQVQQEQERLLVKPMALCLCAPLSSVQDQS